MIICLQVQYGTYTLLLHVSCMVVLSGVEVDHCIAYSGIYYVLLMDVMHAFSNYTIIVYTIL